MFHILVVEDDRALRELFCTVLSKNGFVYHEARDGVEAWDVLEKQYIDLIVTDIMMPNMNGFEFLSKLPNIPYGKTTPVIMLTSRTSNKHREKAFQLGAKAFLNKPCKDEEFVETVTRLTESAALDVVAS